MEPRRAARGRFSRNGKSSRYHDTGISMIGLGGAEGVAQLSVDGDDRTGPVRLEVAAHQRGVPHEAELLQQPQRGVGEVPRRRAVALAAGARAAARARPAAGA